MVHVHAKSLFDKLSLTIGVILAMAGFHALALAQEESAPVEDTSGHDSVDSEHGGAMEVDTDEAPVELPPPRKKVGGGKIIREKVVQGTKAHDRFEPETVNKSKYKINGRPLDVDPD